MRCRTPKSSPRIHKKTFRFDNLYCLFTPRSRFAFVTYHTCAKLLNLHLAPKMPAIPIPKQRIP